MAKKNRVLVLAGGTSEERPVSLSSAKAITEALQRLGYQTSVIDSATGQSLLSDDGRFIYDADERSDSRLALKKKESTALAKAVAGHQYDDIDVVFIALHGGEGENGTYQAILDLAGMTYTGSGKLASAVAMNKDFSKRLMRAEKIPTADWLLLKKSDLTDIGKLQKNIKSKFDLPLIVKPNDSGSTCGLTLVKSWDQLLSAIELAADITKEVLIEKYIKGREITAAILDGQKLPLVEIVPTGELYDYECKYTKGKSQYICPAEISENITIMIQDMALKAYSTIGCFGAARVDFILDARNIPHFLEVNTLPGMTELSLVPMAAKEAGITFDDLIEKTIDSATKK